MLNLNRLALLLELSRRSTLHGVAAALSYSPSTVSQQLRLLEREVGAQLIERVGRGLRLTRQGEILAEHAQRILLAVDTAHAEVLHIGQFAGGTVRLATFQTAALELLPELLEQLKLTEPDLDVVVAHLDPHGMIDALLARDFDVVLGEEYPGQAAERDDAVASVDLLHDPLLVVTPENNDVAWSPQRSSSFSEMPWVMEPKGAAGRTWAENACRELGFEPRVTFESPDLLVQLRLVERNIASAILPSLLVRSAADSVRNRAAKTTHSRRIFAAVRKGSEHDPRVAALIGALQEVTRGFNA